MIQIHLLLFAQRALHQSVATISKLAGILLAQDKLTLSFGDRVYCNKILTGTEKAERQMTKRLLKLTGILAAFSVLLLATPPSAQALPTLFVSDGISSFTIGDGSGSDLDGTPGVVVYSASINNWFLVITVGQTKPFLGSATKPIMELFTIEATSTGGGSLWVKFSENDFVSSAPNVTASVGGTSDGTVRYRTYSDPGNVVLAQTTLLTDTGVLSGPSFSDTTTVAGGLAGPYSLTQWTLTTHSGSGFTSFSAVLQVPDGGVTVGLLGVALLGLEALRRVAGRRFTQAVASK